MLKLVIANKLYSSWSLRPWMVLQRLRYPVRGDHHSIEGAGEPRRHARIFSVRQSSGLVDGEVSVWESLAIIEYLAEVFPIARSGPETQSTRPRTLNRQRNACRVSCRYAKPARCISARASQRRR